MEFKTREEVYEFLKKCTYLDEGSQGKCYVDKEKQLVYKLYFSFLDPFDEDIILEESDILAFKDIKTDMIIFPKDIIKLNGVVIGDITRYVDAQNLYKINPLRVDINWLLSLCELALKEIEYISKEHIKIFDMLYNIMLGNKFYIVDTLEYSKSQEDYAKILLTNLSQFNLSIVFFLVSGIFEEVIKDNHFLNSMYKSLGYGISIIEFIKELKKYLSELVGKEIKTLEEARHLVDKKKSETPYIRLLEL